MKAKSVPAEQVIEKIMARKLKALEIAGAIVQSQARALAKVGKYPAGSGKVGGALRDSIYSKREGDSVKIGTSIVYGAIQEFGGLIRPYRAKALTIPIAPEAIGKNASDFSDLFVLEKDDKVFLAKNENGELKIYYLLLKSVEIPARPYLRPALEMKREEVVQIIQKA